ncbi:transposase [Streptomyces sp. SP18BB07]|uniref:transposase n=1 Tax=Streptomyces sp. SP18BB07 TaxID=3002522 RepID=UPI003FCE73F5
MISRTTSGLFEPLLPLGERGPIPDLRGLVNGVMWRFRTGGPWRDMPERYGPWSTVYGRFHLWVGAGVFQTLLEAVIAQAAARGQADLGLVSVDSTVARAHHHAAGMTVDAELLEALEKAVAKEKGLRQRGQTPGSRAGRAGGRRPRGATAPAPTPQGPAPRRRTGALTRRATSKVHSRRDLVLAVLRCGPRRVRSPRGPEH